MTVAAEVWLWGQQVGAVAEDDSGIITFEYLPAFQRSALEISPIHLPLRTTGPIQFPHLARVDSFQGLPGVLADALPDRFGNAIIAKHFRDQGREDYAMSPLQKLLYMGDRAMGALEFQPAQRGSGGAEKESLEIADLVEQARMLIEGDTSIAVPEIMRIGGSAGGARPKAIILWNPKKNRVRSGFAKPRSGDQPWLIKFDGVGELDAPDPSPQSYNRIEYVYSQMAAKSGINIGQTYLLEERRLAHFMVKRFDRDGDQKLHMHSLGGLQHVDFNQPGAYSYESFLRTINELNLGRPEMEEALRRMLFNLVTVNQDDHVKNLSFLMDINGQWRLAPAYDLTYARGQGYTKQHQMSCNGKRDNFTYTDLKAVATKFGLKNTLDRSLDKVRSAINEWDTLAEKRRVPEIKIERLKAAFRRF